MGIYAHVQVKQPEYGSCHVSAWDQEKIRKLLNENEITVHELTAYDDDHWEIEITEGLEELVARMEATPAEFDKRFNDDPSDRFSEDVSALLREGLNAAQKNNYEYIAIDWF